jgi:hypothetical protein
MGKTLYYLKNISGKSDLLMAIFFSVMMIIILVLMVMTAYNYNAYIIMQELIK